MEVGEETIANKIKELCESRSQQWANSQAEKLMVAAAQNPFQKALYHSLSLSLDMYINMLFEYKKHLSTLKDEIDALAKDIEECRIIQSIPGIGEKIAATIISEIGEIDRFNHPKKLVAFAGIDPSIFESGTFKGTLNRITKRGPSRLRHALYTAVKCAIRDCRKKKRQMKSFLATSDYESFMIRNEKKENPLK